jgi:molybdopterin synthase sulfur carrier subunit
LIQVAAPGGGRPAARVIILFFAAARQAAGIGKESVDASTLAEALEAARLRHGDAFAAVLEGCRVWVNGEPADENTPLVDGDEVAVLPPVSGGAG